MAFQTISTPSRAGERMALAGASAAACFAILGLLGWLAPWRGLATIHPASIPMAPSTAVALLLLGGTMLVEARRRLRGLATVVSLLITVFASGQLAAFLAGLPSALDALLVHDPELLGGVPVGRMSPWTAIGLLLASLSLLFIRHAGRRHGLGVAAGALTFAVCLLGAVVTLGYLFGVPLRPVGPVAPMAFPTALAIGCLGLALLGLSPKDSPLLEPFIGSSARAQLFRAFLPVVPAIVVADLLLYRIQGLNPALQAALTTLVSAGVVAAVVSYAAHGVGRDLERAQAERDRSRRDADRLAAIVRSSTDAIYAKSLDGTIVAWNASAERLYGYTPAEALGRSARSLLPPGGEDELTKILERIGSGEWVEHRGETNRVRKDGSQVLVSLVESPLRDTDDRIVGVSVIARDVSEQRRAEAALLESETKLRALFESDLVGIVFGDTQGAILDANDKFLGMVGCARDDLRRGLRWSTFTAPEFEYLDAAGAAQARQHGSCAPYEKQYIRRDGSRLWVLVGYVLLGPERDRTVAFVLDIDSRKRMEDELLKSEARFARVFRSSLVAIGIAEVSTGRLVDVNACCAEFFGYAIDEMIGRTVFELGLLVDPADSMRLTGGIAAGLGAVGGEAAFRRKSGEIRYGLVSMEAMTLAGMAGPIDMVVLVDITDRKKLEAQLMQAQKMEAVGRLAGGVAHDFNNSLGVILGYTELLLGQADETQRVKLEHILAATHRAAALTRQLLAFSRKQVVDPKVLDLNGLLSHLETMLGRLIGEDIDLAIVPGASLGLVKADPGELEQAVMNLCVNARDAMPDGGLLRIETANADLDRAYAARHDPLIPGRYVMLAVSDSGCGIQPEILSKLFEPFFTTKEQGKGTGLGLSMVYGTVKQAGGYVWVYSEVGLGSTFKVYLPRVDEPVAPAPPELLMPANGWETVLLVEDEGPLRAIAREILEEHGYRVLEAADGDEAIEIAHHHPEPIHLLLTDVVMPGQNGRVLAEQLLARRPELKVLYMSGYTHDVIARSGVLESGTLLLEKPFTARALLVRVRAALGERSTGANP